MCLTLPDPDDDPRRYYQRVILKSFCPNAFLVTSSGREKIADIWWIRPINNGPEWNKYRVNLENNGWRSEYLLPIDEDSLSIYNERENLLVI